MLTYTRRMLTYTRRHDTQDVRVGHPPVASARHELSAECDGQRQCLYFCTSKARKLSTCPSSHWSPASWPTLV